jgi:hypothetical protein
MIGTIKQIIAWLFEQDAGKLYEVKEYHQKRSLTANSYFHVLCDKVAAVAGVSAQYEKNDILADFGQIREDVRTIILRDDIDWHEFRDLHLRPTSRTKILDDGELYRVYFVIRGTHTYNSKEMARVIDGLVQEAKALGVETMPPAELARLIGRWKPKED